MILHFLEPLEGDFQWGVQPWVLTFFGLHMLPDPKRDFGDLIFIQFYTCCLYTQELGIVN